MTEQREGIEYQVTLVATGGHPVDVDGPDLVSPRSMLSASFSRIEQGTKPTIADRTLASTPPSRTSSLPPRDRDFAERYQDRQLLGAGGMGEVRLAKDKLIGRDVAVKFVRAGDGSSGGSQQRFLREARVQGQLEHPSIVPVYDLGVDANDALYFTMKRVRGMSLAEIIDGLRTGDVDLERRFSRRKLLTAFTNVCLTVQFAHTHGVLHRDLKPANIMLGDFGEVYVLDWGLAKILGVDDTPTSQSVSDDSDAAATVAGEVMGTPGYMSPEQLRGSELDARSDVYALGTILFEILALERVHDATSMSAIVYSTVEADVVGPAHRAPARGIPPELDAVCVKALARSPNQRFADARALSDAIERYLDGDRDLELRRALADEHANAARDAFSRAGTTGDEAAERSRAMREVTAALGLDAANQSALHTLVDLLTRPPRSVPPDAERGMVEAARKQQGVAARAAVFVYLGFALYLPFPLWMGVKSWPALAALVAVVGACAIAAFYMSKKPPLDGRVPLGVLFLSALAVVASASMLGPFVIVPTLAMANNMAYLATFGRVQRKLIIAVNAAAVAVPALLQWGGVWPASYSFVGDTLTVLPQMMHFPAVATSIFLLIANLLLVITGALFVARLRDSYNDAERRLHLQAWQLRQIVPETARDLVGQSG